MTAERKLLNNPGCLKRGSKTYFIAYLDDLKKSPYDKGLLWFLVLSLATIAVTYFTNEIIASFWFLFLLVLYYRSDDEPMWLAFFLVTSDGFLGFMGLYSVTLTLIPGLPSIEISQFYVILTVVKVLAKKTRCPLYYRKFLQVLGLYLMFLIVWGLFMGLSNELNMYMRVLKTSLPFLLIYSLPRLLPDLISYKRFFGIVFIIVLSAFALQLFSLLTGIYPFESMIYAGSEIDETEAFRTFYNAISTLIGLLGALLFLSIRGRTGFNNWFLLLVVFAAVMMAVLSATRGWIIAFSLIIILSGLLVRTIDTRKITGLVIISAILVLIGSSSVRIREQVTFSKERLLKMESIRSGDMTAEGTLYRLDVRSPVVMKVWKQSPYFGWGFSDTGFSSTDGHVGNQTLLMFSGLVGFVLLNGFLLYVMFKMFSAFRRSPITMPFRNGYLVFIIFLVGWFVIHSTSSQQFYFNALPLRVMPQAVLLGFSALYYNLSFKPRKHSND
jgi:O-antigen ligase